MRKGWPRPHAVARTLSPTRMGRFFPSRSGISGVGGWASLSIVPVAWRTVDLSTLYWLLLVSGGVVLVLRIGTGTGHVLANTVARVEGTSCPTPPPPQRS